MKILKGTSASSGIARGVSCLYSEKEEENIPHYSISSEGIEGEISRLEQAYKKTGETLARLNAASLKMFGKEGGEIFDVHSMILLDSSIRKDIEDRIKNKLTNAEHAVYDVFSEHASRLKSGKAHFDGIRQDVIAVRDRLVSSFSGSSGELVCSAVHAHPVVVVAKRLTPSMILGLPREHVLAFVTEEGGFTTHATILARNFGVPIVFNVETQGNIDCGDKAIVDGFKGKVIVGPDAATDKEYDARIEKIEKRKAVCMAEKYLPAKTRHGVRIVLKCNISTPNELELLSTVNYDGVGLLRSEFLFSARNSAPSEDEWTNIYSEALDRTRGKSVVVRLVDIGGDKLPDYMALPYQENPDLGIRGARAVDLFRDIYLSQIKGILRASIHGDIRMLYPMVSDVSDIKAFRKILKEAKRDLRREKVKFNASIKEGVMIEVPSAAIMADNILREVDFVNIGSNDLVQYTLAAARGNQLIEKRYHILHPSLVKLMEIVVAAGKKHGKEVCLCGEIADFEEFYPLLLAIGLRSFSVAASKLDDMKCHLLYQKKPSRSIVKEFYSLTTKKAIDKFFARAA
ncbi:MAG: phosphoenolpyruvate--protein phosphotransferase [Candidatus Omnitrophota bacterium]